MDSFGDLDYRNDPRLVFDSEIGKHLLSKVCGSGAVAHDAGALHHLSGSQEMFVICNKFLPVNGYKALTVWPFIFVRCKLSDIDLNHERIHGRQQAEMLLVFFYVWYCVEWLVRVCLYCDGHKAYKNISLECEAYSNEEKADYLNYRRLWSWTKYL